MFRNSFLLTVLFLVGLFFNVSAQDYSMLDPQPYNPKVDPDPDMFIASWKDSAPQQLFGSLIVRDIFTPCGNDPIHPKTKGAVLTNFKRFAYGELLTNTSTTPSKLSGEQIIFYIASGEGTIKAGKQSAMLKEGVGVLLPPGIEFFMSNTGNDLLTMYIISEPIPSGFTPRKEMLVRDEHTIPVYDANAHWSYILTKLFWQEDGLATAIGMGPVWIDPMTMGQPHSHSEGVEEIWFVLDGDVDLLLGKQLRKLSPGFAYKVPPTGMTPHANINNTDKPIKLFWFMKVPPTMTYPDYSMLAPEPYDPKKDPNTDMFMANWRESSPRNIFGTLIERNIFTKCVSDPIHPVTRGAVITYIKGFSYGTLYPGNVTSPTKLDNEQKIFYIASGKGSMNAGGKTAELREGICTLIPPALDFTMKNTGEEPLTMYIITEPIPAGFTPRKDIAVVDEGTLPFTSSDAHWCHCYKNLLSRNEGLSTLVGLGPVWFYPRTMGQPHSHVEGVEEIWFSLKGDMTILLGKQIRKFPEGTAYKIPPNGTTPHSTINDTDEPVKAFWFMRIP